jgi:hypothetical protein
MLFAESELVGTFKGFNERGLEFAAEIVAPYNATMLDQPQLGQFLLVELASPEEAALGRITRFVPSGLLATAEGEDYVNTMQRRQQAVPEDLKQQRLKYRVQVKLLGAVRMDGAGVVYVPSQRRLPHLGARVARPSPAVLSALCKLGKGNTDLGEYTLGEFVFAGHKVAPPFPGAQSLDPRLEVKFDIHRLVSRRSVVFARAGYGKSNLIKFLVAELYRDTPTTEAGLPVGTLIFDPDGEYFWPDRVKGRPGLCDVPQLRDKLVLFTNRTSPSPYYGEWKVGKVKLDIRDLPSRDVIGIGVAPHRQQDQNVLKLKSLRDQEWRSLVDLIHREGLNAKDSEIGALLGYTGPAIQSAAAEIAAARSNMNGVVRLLHDPGSKLLSGTLEALSKGYVVVVDISLLSSSAGNMMAGLLLRRIFSHNQENFTGGSAIIPTVAIIEEAQSVLGGSLDDSSPFVEWVKEGRKYDLGAVLVTQQPGSLASELLSQADNWFCFHLLSETDARTLVKHNAHFSDDVLAHLIGEPIPGNCFMWSAPHQPFVLPVRIRNFGELYEGNIRGDIDAQSQSLAKAASQVTQSIQTSFDRLADALRHRLRQSAVKLVDVPCALNGRGAPGIKEGQLYYLIKEVKEPTDTQSENALKLPLLEALLGEGEVQYVEHDGQKYFCAPATRWELALGRVVQVSGGTAEEKGPKLFD